MNRDHNMSAWTFGHLSAQSTVEYSMLTYLITYVASYSISSSYKNFDNWSYLHYHLVFFFFYLITYVASYSISSSYKNSDNWSYLHFFFFPDVYMLSNFCVWNNSSLEFTHRVKSISMANFSAEEVSALQGGGNEVYFDIHLQLMYWLFFFFLFVSPFMYILVADH